MKVCLLISFVAVVCSGATIPVATVTPSSTFFTYDAANLINGSGLSGGLADDNFHNMWMTNGTTTGTLVFDLGSVFSLADTLVWNYNADCCGLGRGVQNMTALISTNGITYTSIGSFSLTQGTGSPIPDNVLNLGGATGRYVKFDLTANYGDTTYIGLSEVQFESSTVPEPSTSALYFIGASVLAFLLKRNPNTLHDRTPAQAALIR